MAHDKKTWEDVLESIRNGMTFKDACVVNGVGESTFHEKKVVDPDFSGASKSRRAGLQGGAPKEHR